MRLFLHQLRTRAADSSGATARRRSSSSSSRSLLYLLLGAVYDGTRSTACPAADRPARRAARLRLREHGLRRARDHARDPPRERHPQAHPCDAAAARDVPRGGARLHARRLRATDGRARRARRGCSTARTSATEIWLASCSCSCSAPRRSQASASGDGVADPLGRGLLRRRQPRRAADGVPLRLVRADAPVPRLAAADRRHAPAAPSRRGRERRTSARRAVLARPRSS